MHPRPILRRCAGAAWAIALAALPVASTAALPDEIQVYTDAINAPGKRSLEVHVNTTPRGNLEQSFAGERITPHGLRLTPEFAFGITPTFEAGLYLPMVFDASLHGELAGIKPRLKWLPVRRQAGDDDQAHAVTLRQPLCERVHAVQPPADRHLPGHVVDTDSDHRDVRPERVPARAPSLVEHRGRIFGRRAGPTRLSATPPPERGDRSGAAERDQTEHPRDVKIEPALAGVGRARHPRLGKRDSCRKHDPGCDEQGTDSVQHLTHASHHRMNVHGKRAHRIRSKQRACHHLVKSNHGVARVRADDAAPLM